MTTPPDKVEKVEITLPLVQKIITKQFPEFSNMVIKPVKIQGHDNYTFRLGSEMLIRMPTAAPYALKVPKEQKLLPQLSINLTIPIPTPLKVGSPSEDYPFNFSIYKWLDGQSANTVEIEEEAMKGIAYSLAQFLQELQSIDPSNGPLPGLHNWWRGDHISVYNDQARTQISSLKNIIDGNKALALWERACNTRWNNSPVWVHGDFASGNILLKNGYLAGIIDFGGLAIGDPACDLVIFWTFLKGKARDIFKQQVLLDEDTWLRARGWALWKATFELCNIADKNSPDAILQRHIINEVLYQA